MASLHAQSYEIIGITIDYEYEFQNGWADGTGTCSTCWTRVRRMAYFDKASSNPIANTQSWETKDQEVRLSFFEQRTFEETGKTTENYCYSQKKDRDAYSARMVPYCEARRFPEEVILTPGTYADYGNGESIDLQDLNKPAPQSFARVWMLPKVSTSQVSGIGLCEPLFKEDGIQVSAGHWEYITPSMSSWKPLEHEAYKNQYPLSISGETINTLIPEDLERERALSLRFVLTAEGSGFYRGWNSSTVQSETSEPKAQTTIAGLFHFQFLNCSPLLSVDYHPNPLPIPPLCAEQPNGSFTVFFERGLQSYRDEKMNLVVKRIEGEEAYLIDGKVVIAGEMPGNSLTWDPVLPPGTYILEWQTKSYGNDFSSVPDAFLKSNPFVISDRPLLTLSASAVHVSCRDGNDGQILMEANGGSPPYTYRLGGAPMSKSESVIDGLFAGTYQVEVQDAMGCFSATTVRIEEPFSNPEVSLLGVVSPTGFGRQDGGIGILTSGGVPPYTYQWTKDGIPFEGEDFLQGLGKGDYQVLITDSKGCFSDLLEITLTEPDPVTAEIQVIPERILCPWDKVQLVVMPSGGTSEEDMSYTYLWQDGNTQRERYNMEPGNYSVIVRDKNGNEGMATLQIQAPLEPEVRTIVEPVSCFGGNNGSIQLEISGGTPPYEVIWSRAGDPGFQQEGLSLTKAPSGYYYYSVKDAAHCDLWMAAEPVWIQEPQQPLHIEAELVSDPTFYDASDGFIQWNIEGGTPPYSVEYWKNEALWEINSGGSFTADNLKEGSYVARITDAMGCEIISDEVTLVSPPPLHLEITTILMPSCHESNDGTISVLTAGGTPPYTLSVWNADGMLQAVHTVEGSQATLKDLPSGVFEIGLNDVTEATGVRFQVVLNAPDPLRFSIASVDVGCFGETTGAIAVVVEGGTPPYVYDWNTGDRTAEIDGLPAGGYLLKVTDAAFCTDWVEVQISQPQAALDMILHTITHNTVFGGSEGSLQVSVAGGRAPYLIRWYRGQELIGSGEGISQLTAGIYQAEVTDATGSCSLVKTFEIKQPGPLQISIIQESELFCFGDRDGVLVANASGGVPPYQFSWEKEMEASWIPDTHTSERWDSVAEGRYRVTATDVSGAKAVSEVFTVVSPSPLNITLTESSTPRCALGNDGFLEIAVSGGTPPYQIFWDHGTSGISAENLSSGRYRVRLADALGCLAEEEFLLEEEVAPLDVSLHVIPPAPGANSGRIDVFPSGGAPEYQLEWRMEEEEVWQLFSESITGLPGGRYEVRVTDARGCDLVQEVALQETDPFVAEVKDPECFNSCDGSIRLSPLPGYEHLTFQWENGDVTQERTGLCPGTYTVHISGLDGGLRERVWELSAPMFAVPELPENITICAGASYVLDGNTGTEGVMYSWKRNGVFLGYSPDFLVEEPGQYELNLQWDNGCSMTLYSEVTVSESPVQTAFIMATQAMTREKVVAVEVSTPVPESVRWMVPEEAQVHISNSDYLEISFPEPGVYEIGLETTAEGCTQTRFKSITILESEEGNEVVQTASNIHTLVVYPNPNKGKFQVKLVSDNVIPISAEVYQLANNHRRGEVYSAPSLEHLLTFDLGTVPAGLYALILKTEDTYKVHKIVVE